MRSTFAPSRRRWKMCSWRSRNITHREVGDEARSSGCHPERSKGPHNRYGSEVLRYAQNDITDGGALPMNLFRGFSAILYKEFIVVFRDRTTLFFMFFPPLLQIIAFGFALDNDVKHMAMVVLNEDRTAESRALIDAFVNTETFRVVGEVTSVEELAETIRSGKVYAGLQIPPDFTRNIRAGRKATVQVLIDGSNSMTALQAMNTAVAVALRRSVK